MTTRAHAPARAGAQLVADVSTDTHADTAQPLQAPVIDVRRADAVIR